MTQRRYGPTKGAGTVIIEKESEKAITPAALGVTAYTGIMEKGPIGKLFRSSNKTDFLFKGGNITSESQLPDAALNFFSLSNGAGEIWFNRVTDGSEKKASLIFKNRLDAKSDSIKVYAGNAGRWAGKKIQPILDEYDSVTANTLTLDNVPSGLQDDELVGALLKLKAVPGKSYEVISNTSAGVLTFASDVNLIEDIDGSADKLLSVEMSNDGKAVAVKFKNGLTYPDTEWGLDVYLIEGGIATLQKSFDDLSSDPNADNYYADIINTDSMADYLISVEDLETGLPSADKRPANISSISESLTATVLSAKIYDLFVNSVNLATAELQNLSLGADIVKDKITLTCSVAGSQATETLTFGAIPDDNDTISINGFTITFKTVVADPIDEVLIGGTIEETVDNLITYLSNLNETDHALLYKIIYAEKTGASTIDVFAYNSGVAGNSILLASAGGGNEPTFGGANLSSGVDQVWTFASERMPFVTGLTVTTGVAFTAPNDFGFGFTLNEISGDSTKTFDIADSIIIEMAPYEVNGLVDGILYPNVTKPRFKFTIISNTVDSITVKTGSDMTSDASTGDKFRVEYIQELEGGYDGIANIDDLDYETAYDTSTSILKNLRGKNLGLVKLATPGVTSTSVQKAGVAFAESQNWQYRYEIPYNITDELDAEEYCNDTLGRNDFAVTAWPSYIKVSKSGGGLKLITATGAIHGVEARFARNYDGYHKAAAGIDAILSNALALPDGFENQKDEEFLNPVGINVLKFKEGNVIIWGDRTLSLDPAYKYKHQREYLSHVENVLLENFDYIIFALNNNETREQLKSSFIQYFTPELAKSAIVGDSLQDAINLKIDDENNTAITEANGDLNAELSLRIVGTVERFIITIGKLGVTESLA